VVVVSRQEDDVVDMVVGDEFQQLVTLPSVAAPPGFAIRLLRAIGLAIRLSPRDRSLSNLVNR